MVKDSGSIRSLQNPRVKALVRLRERRGRDEQGLFLIEEPLVIRRALLARCPVQTVLYCPDLLTDPADRALFTELTTTGPRPPETIRLAAHVMARISYRDRPGGLMVTAPLSQRRLTDLPQRGDALLVVLENVQKPGNVGAVLRCADGAGADAVLLTGRAADLFNPNVLRSSRGAVFCLPTVTVPSRELLAFLTRKRIRIVCVTPEASRRHTDVDWRGPVALVLGAEDQGLSDFWRERAELEVSIPMLGCGDSLNVATAAAVILYEAVRQRGHGRRTAG